MSFYSVAVTVLIVCYRRGDVKARPQDEESAYTFVRQPASLHSGTRLDKSNSYVDPSHSKYHQRSSTSAVAVAAAAAAAAAASAPTSTMMSRSTISPLKVARDDRASDFFSGGLSDENAIASKMGKTRPFRHSNAAEAITSATTASFDSNRLDGVVGSASSFHGFATADNSVFSPPSLPLPPPPPPPSFSFPTGRPAFGQFGPSSSFTYGASNYDNRGSGNGGSSSEAAAAAYHNVEPIVHKSVYVHVAPQEDYVPQQKVILPKIAPKKNFQIVFIKTPTPPPPSAPVIPPFPPQSDKTLIYVLHPKPEEAPPIHIPAPPQSTPIKPEVYFIKYKSKKEQDEDDLRNNQNDDNNEIGTDSYRHPHRHHQRRFGRDGLEEEPETEALVDVDDESLDATDSAAAIKSATALSLHDSESGSSGGVGGDTGEDGDDIKYEGRNSDSSGESSNIVRIYASERGGKNAH